MILKLTNFFGMRFILIIVILNFSSHLYSQYDTIYINTFSVNVLKSEIKKYDKGDFYDLAFKKPKSKQDAILKNLKTIPVLIVFNQDGEKLCRRDFYRYYLPSKIDKDYIEENFKKCFEQYRETETGEKIPELIPYNLQDFLDKTEPLFSKKDLKENTYTVLFNWRYSVFSSIGGNFQPDLKKYLKKLYKATKKENFNLIRLNRDIQKDWGFGDSLSLKLKYHKKN